MARIVFFGGFALAMGAALLETVGALEPQTSALCGMLGYFPAFLATPIVLANELDKIDAE